MHRPICVAEHLTPFLPTHPHLSFKNGTAIDAISAAPFGSASIHLISWAYIRMLGGKGLSDSSKIALLNANYMVIDLAEFDKTAGLKVADFAKRLQVCFLYLRRAYLIYIGRITGSTPRLVPGQFQHVC